MFPVLATWRPPLCRTIYTINIFFLWSIFSLGWGGGVVVLGIFFLFTHYLEIFTKSYLQITQNIQTPLQTVKVLTPDLLTVLESSFGEDYFGFTVWVLVDSCSTSVHVFIPVKNNQGNSHPVGINTEEYSPIMKHIQGVVERLNMYPWRRYYPAGICIPQSVVEQL